MPHFFFIHSPVDGHMVQFQALAIMSCLAANMGMHVSYNMMPLAFSERYLEREKPGQMEFIISV